MACSGRIVWARALAMGAFLTVCTAADASCPIDRMHKNCTSYRSMHCQPIPQQSLAADPASRCSSSWKSSPLRAFPYPSDVPGWWASPRFLHGYLDHSANILVSPAIDIPQNAQLQLDVAYNLEPPPKSAVRSGFGPNAGYRCRTDGWDGAAIWYRMAVSSSSPEQQWHEWQTLTSTTLPYDSSSVHAFTANPGRCGMPGWSGSSNGWHKAVFDLAHTEGQTVQFGVIIASDWAVSTQTNPDLFGLAVRNIRVVQPSTGSVLFADGERDARMLPSGSRQPGVSSVHQVCASQDLRSALLIQCSFDNHFHDDVWHHTWPPRADYLSWNPVSQFGLSSSLPASLQMSWVAMGSSTLERVELETVPLSPSHLAGMQTLYFRSNHRGIRGLGYLNARLVLGAGFSSLSSDRYSRKYERDGSAGAWYTMGEHASLVWVGELADA
eukprot:TRINITY_DN5608_c0_g1_i6.p1 TRINITY_DN5608_c0_g1~~TRINITY_DN5608_c0_g1_i6.p1  ORF type:complete len:439 (-),score=39.29 TRINITY_DN5608_c0_g1_i6:243-1559(-)